MTEITTFEAFYSFSSGALWLLSVLLFKRTEHVNTTANIWLGIFFFILACTFAQLFLEASNTGSDLVIPLLELPTWAMFPCLYMAVHHYVLPSSAKKGWFLHFVPFLLFALFSCLYLIPNTKNEQYKLPELSPWVRFIIKYFFLGQMIYYWTVCFSLFRLHQKNVKMLASFTDRIDLKWLKYLLIGILFLIFIRLMALISVPLRSLSPIMYFIGIIYLAHLTLNQKSIYDLEPELQEQKPGAPITKASNERLTPEQVDELKKIVLKKSIDDKLFLDPSLTLSIFASKVGISTHELSYILNQGLGKSFYQFINELRTEEAKTLLLSEHSKHLDMLGIAIRAGFNSKTTFYTAFKKATNCTPKEYIKSNSKTN